jgi:ubiquinone/menaquinone biosynthesis C-methylase UbiE
MLAQAAALSPGIEFLRGNLFELPLEDRSLAGIAAFYALVNYDIDSVDRAFSEFYRVLDVGGILLLAFHTGNNELYRAENFFSTGLVLDFCFFSPDDIISKLQYAGFSIEEAVVRYPYKEEHPTKRAYILAKKT